MILANLKDFEWEILFNFFLTKLKGNGDEKGMRGINGHGNLCCLSFGPSAHLHSQIPLPIAPT